MSNPYSNVWWSFQAYRDSFRENRSSQPNHSACLQIHHDRRCRRNSQDMDFGFENRQAVWINNRRRRMHIENEGLNDGFHLHRSNSSHQSLERRFDWRRRKLGTSSFARAFHCFFVSSPSSQNKDSWLHKLSHLLSITSAYREKNDKFSANKSFFKIDDNEPGGLWIETSKLQIRLLIKKLSLQFDLSKAGPKNW